MKILLIQDCVAPIGGAEIQLLALREGLRRQGHEVRLFASRIHAGAGASQADDLCFGTTSSLRTLVQSANPAARRALRRVIEQFKPDVAHVGIFLTQLSPLIMPLLRRIPTVYHAQWYRPVCPLGTKMLPDGRRCTSHAGAVCYRSGCLPLRDWVPLMFQMKLFDHWRSAFDRIVVSSQTMKRTMEAEGFDNLEVIWIGVEPAPQRPALQDPPAVAFAGRLVFEKGADTLLRAFAKVTADVPAARLIIAGDGPQRNALESLIDQLSLRSKVCMRGQLSRAQLEREFASVWVQTAPSRWVEPYGMVAAEAMMRGTAVVASDAGGFSELIEHQRTGLLVESQDVDAWAAALRRLLNDRDEAERLGLAARRFAVEHLTVDKMIERFIGLYESLIHREAMLAVTS